MEVSLESWCLNTRVNQSVQSDAFMTIRGFLCVDPHMHLDIHIGTIADKVCANLKVAFSSRVMQRGLAVL